MAALSPFFYLSIGAEAMSNLFSFRCRASKAATLSSSLVVFCPPGMPSAADISDAIMENTARALSPEGVYFLCEEEHAAQLFDDLFNDNDVLLPVSHARDIVILSYSTTGEVTINGALKGGNPNDFEWSVVARQGLTQLFVNRGGLVKSGPTSHFVKPSKKPDRRFLRASSALSDGAEIFFVALCLLPHFSGTVRTVHLDTSSIASVVMAAILMSRRKEVPIVRTFHSYDKLKQHNFSKDEAELVVISASQSGAMATQLAELIGGSSRIITIFNSSDLPAAGEILCDLNFDAVVNPSGISAKSPNESFEGSRPIKLVGEHFLSEPEPPRSALPGIRQNPSINSSLVSRVMGKGVFTCNFKKNRSLPAKSVWINADKLLSTENYKEWLEIVCLRDIPAAVAAIVYIDVSDGSKVFANDINKELSRHNAGQNCRIIALSEIDGSKERLPPSPPDKVPVIIAGGITGHGDDLLSVSRALRDWAPSSHRIFLSPICVPSSSAALKVLDQNLRQPNSHVFKYMDALIIDRRGLADSWEKERQLLSDHSDNIPNDLLNRMMVLNSSSGMSNNLFLAGKKSELVLRKNFAFWPQDVDCEKALQADVFVAISCLIHNMRTNSDIAPDRRILNDANTHTIISAGSFARFNDGIIQASIIRAAEPVELNYVNSPEESRIMGGVIVDMIKLVDRQQGEAITEFLLAIVTKRLQLREQDMCLVRDELESSNHLSETQAWFAQLIASA